MRSVYIDVLITVNIFIDFFLLLCTKLALNLNCSLPRLIAGSVEGGAFSLFALIPSIPPALNILLDIALSFPIVLTAFGAGSVKNLLKRIFVFFSCSFIFCGIMIFVYTSFRPSGMEIYNNVVYFNISPVLLIILTLVCYYFMKAANRYLRGNITKTVCEVQIIEKNSAVKFTAIVDTGCNIKEPFSGEYVILADKALLKSISLPFNHMRIIPYGSLKCEGYIEGFCPDSVTIDGKSFPHGLFVGICENMLKGDVKAIVPYGLLY